MSLRLFFRRIEVEGKQNLPAGPILLVSNHTNALVDPLLPMIVLRRRLTLTAKNVLKKNPLLAVLTWGIGAISFHRAEDAHKGAHPRENVKSMQRCREVLAGGGAISMFPEGISHSDLTMRRFHVGAARIALDYVKKNGDARELKIIPMGILYTAKDQFRSEVWLRFGPAIAMGQWVREHPQATADALTEEIRCRIEALTIGYENRREMLIVNWASDIVATQARIPRMLGATEPSVSESFERLTRLQSGYRTLAQSHGPQIGELADRVRKYRGDLKRRGIEPAEVYLPIHPLRAIFFIMRELELILVGAPLALLGIINFLLPYLLVRTIARRLSVDKDHWATNVIYPGMVVFPLFYCLQVGAAFALLPAFWAALYAIVAPYTGYYAILYNERAGSAWRRASTFVYFCLRPKVREVLVSEGRQIFAGINALSGHLQQQENIP